MGSSSRDCEGGAGRSSGSDAVTLAFLPVSRLMTRATFAESSSWRRLSNPLCSPGRCLLASGFFTQNLLCQPSVVEIATRGFIIGADRLPGTCCFSEFHRPMYHSFIGEILKLVMDFLEDITVKFRASVIHGWQRTHHEDLIVLSHDTLNNLGELFDTVERVVTGLNTDGHFRCSTQSIDRQNTERRRTVNEDIVITACELLPK